VSVVRALLSAKLLSGGGSYFVGNADERRQTEGVSRQTSVKAKKNQ